MVELPASPVSAPSDIPESAKVQKTSLQEEKFFEHLEHLGKMDRAFAKIYPNSTLPGTTIYVHGFNNGFREEVWRAAKLERDTSIGGLVVYDWPSASSTFGYLNDRNSAEFSAEPFADFLSRASTRLQGAKINIIAHSMGGYVVVRALGILADRQQLPLIENLVLAAPDVDVKYFDQQMAHIVPTGKIKYVTVYASSSDLALKASRIQNGYAPLGLLPNVSRLKGLRTVDASSVSPSFTGHDYLASSPEVENDLEGVLREIGPFRPTRPSVGIGKVIYPRLNCPAW